MFQNLFDTIVDKLSNLNPVRHFIKYALDKTLNEFLAKQLTLEDFKNGPLNLNNIEINSQKINREHLVSSPYIIHYGIIQYLKISLPPLSQISTQSIQIAITGIQLTLKPNKKFAENFKQKMLELHELKNFYVQQKQLQGQISENGPVDFFKQLVKNILLNIKVKVNNIVIKLYMNTPEAEQNPKHPQFYTMLRIPMIHLDKKQEKYIKKGDTQEIKFNILVPQISLHLLREDTKYPDYCNTDFKQGDFPFNYPHVHHPSTILLIGSSKLYENLATKVPIWRNEGTLKNYKFSNFCIHLTIDYTKKSKELKLGLDVENVEVMANAVQLKIISRFVIQIMEFKKILQRIIQQLRLQTGQSLMLTKKNSRDSIYKSNDLFSSFMTSISSNIEVPQGLQRNRSSKNKDILQSFIDKDNEMKASIYKFNTECEKQLKLKLSVSNSKQNDMSMTMSVQEFQAINFTNKLIFNVDLNSFKIYILKHNTAYDYARYWIIDKEKNVQDMTINDKIGCSYFLFSINKTQVHFKKNQKNLEASFKNLNMYNVKVINIKAQSTIDDYYDIGDSVEFYSMGVKIDQPSSFIRSEPQLVQFKLSDKSHYCAQQILKISQQQSKQNHENIKNSKIKHHCLIPQFKHETDAYVLYKPGFSMLFDNKNNYIKTNIQTITVSIHFQVIQDLLNIVYPIFSYRRLSQMINFKRAELNTQNLKPENKAVNLFQSRYQQRFDFSKSMHYAQTDAKPNSQTVILEVKEVKMGFKKGGFDEKYKDLVKKCKDKFNDQDSFDNKICFCQLNEKTCLYLQLYELQLKKKQDIKFSCKNIEAGVYSLEKSEIKNLQSILRVDVSRQMEGLRFFKQDRSLSSVISLFVPDTMVKFSDTLAIPIIQLAIDSLKITQSLMAYHHYLQNQMIMIDMESSQIPKKNKRNENSEKQLRIFVKKLIVDCGIATLKSQKIYFGKLSEGNMTVKASSLIVGIQRQKSHSKQTMKTRLCQYRNQQMLLTDYPRSAKNQYIADSDVILQISDSERNTNYTFNSKDKDKFFNRLEKQSFSINFSFHKKQLDRNETSSIYQAYPYEKKPLSTTKMTKKSTFSKPFKFNHANSTIQQEGIKFIMSLQLTKNVNINICNLLEILKYKDRIKECLEIVKTKNQELMSLRSQKIILQRKSSSEMQNQIFEINMKFSQILLDCRPDFIRYLDQDKKQSKVQRVFGPTRSVIILDINETQLLINKQSKEKSTKQLTTMFNIYVHFLYSEDRQINLNPLILKDDPTQLSHLGFKNILQVSKFSLQYKNLNDQHIISTKVMNILGQMSLQTIQFIKLHCQHFINHHIKRQMGVSMQQIYEGEQFCNLQLSEEFQQEMQIQRKMHEIITEQEAGNIIIIGDQEENSFIVQDLSQALIQYQQKLNLKKKDKEELKKRVFVHKNIDDSIISLQSFVIEKAIVRISNGNDFNFIKAFDMGDSIVQKRVRMKQPEEDRYISLSMNSLHLIVDIDSSIRSSCKGKEQKLQLDMLNAFLNLQKVKVTISKQKNLGHASLKLIEQQIQQKTFILCSNENEICMILQKSPDKIFVKTYSLKMKIGMTSQLITLLKSLKKYEKSIQSGGWKKIYDQTDKNKDKENNGSNQVKKQQRLLLLVPESSIKLSLQYQNFMNILDQQVLTTQQLLLNEQMDNMCSIKNEVRKWINCLIKDNLGSLISRTALNLLIKLISQLIALNISFIGKILGFFFSLGGE